MDELQLSQTIRVQHNSSSWHGGGYTTIELTNRLLLGECQFTLLFIF